MCVLVTCKAYSFSDKHVTSGWKEEEKKKKDRKGREKLFLPTVGIFPLGCTKNYCVARGQDEKYMSGERIFPWQPAPVRALLIYAFHTEKCCVLFYCALCSHCAKKELISRVTRNSAGSPAFCQFIYWEEYTHAHTNTHTHIHTHTGFFTGRSYH